MLTLTFLGVGAAFTKRNYQSNALVEAWSHGPGLQPTPDETLLIDFGATAPRALFELMHRKGFEYLERNGDVNFAVLPRVFITHLHADHIGGLEELAIKTCYARVAGEKSQMSKPQLFSSRDILDDLWEHSLRGGLGAMRGRRAGADDYFNLMPLAKVDDRRLQPFCLLDRFEFTPFATNHIQMIRPFDWPSFGLLFRDKHSGRTAVYSADTRFDPQYIVPLMDTADLCFHEVQFTKEAEPVHTLLDELRTLPGHVRAKTLLYHFEDFAASGSIQASVEDFRGLAEAGERYVVFEGRGS